VEFSYKNQIKRAVEIMASNNNKDQIFSILAVFMIFFLSGACSSGTVKINKQIGVTPNTENLRKNTYLVFQFDLIDQVYNTEKWKSFRNTREQQMTELFETYLIKYGKTIVDRSRVNQLLKEMNFNQTGLSTEDGKRIGKMANADVMLFGTISRLTWWTDTKTILIITSIKAIHVESGILLWKGDLDGSINYGNSPTSGESEVQELSRRLFDELLSNVKFK
jgi:hypothetical protein